MLISNTLFLYLVLGYSAPSSPVRTCTSEIAERFDATGYQLVGEDKTPENGNFCQTVSLHTSIKIITVQMVVPPAILCVKYQL